MGKSNHFLGQMSYGQPIKSLDKKKITEISLKYGGEKYVKKFNCFTHLLTMLYAVIMRFETLRDIETAMTAVVKMLHHIGIESVPKLKKSLVYETKLDLMYQNEQGQMPSRGQIVVFRKGEVSHIARIITYVDIKKGKAKLISLLTNDFDMDIETIVEIYRRRWLIESLFKQLKQNFPLRYF